MLMQLIEGLSNLSVGVFAVAVLYFVARLLLPDLNWWRSGFHATIVRNIGNIDPNGQR